MGNPLGLKGRKAKTRVWNTPHWYWSHPCGGNADQTWIFFKVGLHCQVFQGPYLSQSRAALLVFQKPHLSPPNPVMECHKASVPGCILWNAVSMQTTDKGILSGPTPTKRGKEWRIGLREELSSDKDSTGLGQPPGEFCNWALHSCFDLGGRWPGLYIFLSVSQWMIWVSCHSDLGQRMPGVISRDGWQLKTLSWQTLSHWEEVSLIPEDISGWTITVPTTYNPLMVKSVFKFSPIWL